MGHQQRVRIFLIEGIAILPWTHTRAMRLHECTGPALAPPLAADRMLRADMTVAPAIAILRQSQYAGRQCVELAGFPQAEAGVASRTLANAELAERSGAGQKARAPAWSAMDANGNGYVSLAEADG